MLRKPIVWFFILTFTISWSIWTLSNWLFAGATIFVLLGAWGPTISAVIISMKSDGRSNTKKLLKKVLSWKVPVRYYLIAILGMLVIGTLAVGVNFLLNGQLPPAKSVLAGLGLEPDHGFIIIVLAPVIFLINTLVGGPIAEELGWRGFAQPRLNRIMSPALAGLSIGFLWALWHLPLFYIMPEAVGGMPLPYYVVLLSSMGVLFAWLHQRTDGSVLLAIIFHGGFNFTFGLLGADLLEDIFLLKISVVLTVVTAIFAGIHLRSKKILKRNSNPL